VPTMAVWLKVPIWSLTAVAVDAWLKCHRWVAPSVTRFWEVAAVSMPCTSASESSRGKTANQAIRASFGLELSPLVAMRMLSIVPEGTV
jgi:hypothetical protein